MSDTPPFMTPEDADAFRSVDHLDHVTVTLEGVAEIDFTREGGLITATMRFRRPDLAAHPVSVEGTFSDYLAAFVALAQSLPETVPEAEQRALEGLPSN